MSNFHAYPPVDLVAHEISEDCVCIPSVRALQSPNSTDWLYTHHSLDGRGRGASMSDHRVIPEAAVDAAVGSGWQVRKVRAKIRKGGKQREFIWEVTCPDNPPEPGWDNDFGRGMRCGCRRFPTEGKATRYVERMKEGTK